LALTFLGLLCRQPERVTPDELLAAVRGHWQVENGLHFIKDRWWDEDRRYNTRPRVALGFAGQDFQLRSFGVHI
jgi:hypothetical protein